MKRRKERRVQMRNESDSEDILPVAMDQYFENCNRAVGNYQVSPIHDLSVVGSTCRDANLNSADESETRGWSWPALNNFFDTHHMRGGQHSGPPGLELRTGDSSPSLPETRETKTRNCAKMFNRGHLVAARDAVQLWGRLKKP